MADRKLIREALKKRGMAPADIESILNGSGNVEPGYWDDAEVRGALGRRERPGVRRAHRSHLAGSALCSKWTISQGRGR
jgi:hypothetical protein